MAKTKIKIERLYKIFGTKPKPMLKHVEQGISKQDLLEKYNHVLALNNINIDIPAHEITVIMGLSGSGKSTLIRHINRLIDPTAGKVIIDDEDVLAMKKSQLINFRRHKASMVFQKFGLHVNRTVAENAAYGLVIQGFWKAVNTDQSLIDEAKQIIAHLHINEFSDVPAGELSHGKRRELEVACALALTPKVLLLDEPMAGLDPASTAGLIQFLEKIKQQIPILLIEHDMDAVFQLSDRISVLVYGKIVFSGTPDEIKTSSIVREAYLGEEA